MATDLGRKKSASTAEYENRVQGQLHAAEKRIRNLDLAASLLTFAAGTLAYAVVAALLDRWLLLPPTVRQAGLAVYLLAAAAYLTAFVFLPLSRRINPYFAARQLEQTLPDAKNSVVNWLDLRDANLPPAIRGAVGQRAARTVADADPEKAVSGRRAWTAGAVAAVCAVAFVVALFTVGFGSFFGFLGRIFSPFGASAGAAAPTGTQIRVVKPADGDAVVPGDQGMEFLVRVDGRAPDPNAADALKLQFHYDKSAPYQQRPLEAADGGRWGVSLPAGDVHDGFWYKVTGGDAETPEYRVRLTPRVLAFQTVYTFRPYTAKAKETRPERKIEALRGTQVDVTVHTNRDVKDGWLQFETADNTTAAHSETLPGDPQGFTVRLTLDESSQYRIGFTSAEGEAFVESQAYPLIAVPDRPPVVTLTEPAEQKDRPGWVAPLQADGLLQLAGLITDDVGVAAARLNITFGKDDKAPAEEYQSLPSQEFRSRDALKLPHGGNPTRVEYKDFVDLTKLKNPADPLFTVRPGMVLEYWLTAEDACDYPDPKKPNVGESKHYHVLIAEPMNNPQVQKDQRDKAENEKKEAEKQGDAQARDEDKQRQDENQKKQEGNPSGSGKNNNDPQAQPKPGDKPQDGDKPDKANPDQGNKGADPQAEKKQVQDAANDIRKGQEGSGKNDPGEHQADAKDGPPKEPPPQKPGDSKEGGKEGAKDASQPKDGPQDKPGEKHDQGTAKDQGKPGPNQPQQGEAKPGGDPGAKSDAKPGEGKDGQTEAAPQPSEGKPGGAPDDQKQAGGAKPQPDAAGDKTPKAEGKEGNPSNPMGDGGPAGQAKDKPAPEGKAEAKPGPDGSDGNAPKSQGKGDGKQNAMDDPKQASGKEGGEKADQKDAAKPKEEGKAGPEPSSAEEKAKDLDEAVKKLQEDLKSKDPQKREMAEEFIRRYMMNADDPKVREQAKKLLEDAGLDPKERSLADSKPLDGADQPPPTPPPPPAEGKKDGPDKDAQPKETPKDAGKPGDSKGDGKAPPDPTQKQPPPPPSTAKDRREGGAWRPSDVHQPNDPGMASKPETPLTQPKGLLQLFNFWQMVPKDVLKDVLADANQQKVLEAAAVKAAEELPAAQHDGPLNSTVGKVSNPNGQKPNDDPNNGGRALPPPGYREPYKEFTKLLSPGGDK